MFSKESKLYKSHIIEEMLRNPDNVEEAFLKCPKPKADPNDMCKAVLIDAPTQAGKTLKCFQVMQEKMKKMSGRILCLYISRANSFALVRHRSSSVLQTILALPITRSIWRRTSVQLLFATFYVEGGEAPDGGEASPLMVADMMPYVLLEVEMAFIAAINCLCDGGSTATIDETVYLTATTRRCI